jgi:hypothetical protein
MNMLSLLTVLACTAPVAPSDGAPSSTTASSSVERLLVFSLSAEGVDARLVRSLERAVVQAADDAGYDAMSNQDIASVLDIEAAKQAAGCEGTSSCLAEIAGGMGASLVVTGTVVALDASHFELSLTLLGDNATRVLARASGTASSTGGLRDEAIRTANRLLAAARGGDDSSSNNSSSDHTGAVVWIGAGTVGVVGGAVVGVLGALTAINAVNAKAATERAATAYQTSGLESDAADVVADNEAYSAAQQAWNSWGLGATIVGGVFVVGGLVAAGVGVASLME